MTVILIMLTRVMIRMILVKMIRIVSMVKMIMVKEMTRVIWIIRNANQNHDMTEKMTKGGQRGSKEDEGDQRFKEV